MFKRSDFMIRKTKLVHDVNRIKIKFEIKIAILDQNRNSTPVVIFFSFVIFCVDFAWWGLKCVNNNLWHLWWISHFLKALCTKRRWKSPGIYTTQTSTWASLEPKGSNLHVKSVQQRNLLPSLDSSQFQVSCLAPQPDDDWGFWREKRRGKKIRLKRHLFFSSCTRLRKRWQCALAAKF